MRSSWRRLTNFAKSKAGQGYADLLFELKMTPSEFGKMNEYDKCFMIAAWNERTERMNKSLESKGV